MSKQSAYLNELQPMLDEPTRLRTYLLEQSNLPGPRANLELLFALAGLYRDRDTLLAWAAISEDEADGNQPEAYLVCCAAACLGHCYAEQPDQFVLGQLKVMANDGRWRVREGVAFGLQAIGEQDFDALRSIIDTWIAAASNHERRAILAALAHPPMLNAERAAYCLTITERILQDMDRENDFDALRKGLNYAISVFAAVDPERGLDFIEEHIGIDKTLDRIMRENLKKNRLQRKDPKRTATLLAQIQ